MGPEPGGAGPDRKRAGHRRAGAHILPIRVDHRTGARRRRWHAGSHALNRFGLALGVVLVAHASDVSWAQTPPSSAETSSYVGLLAAAARGDATRIKALTARGENPDVRDSHGRTPLHVATYGGHHDVMRALVAAGADPNALENDRYDIVTIAAVANDVATLNIVLSLGASAKNVTSRYDGTALIAAAHLGHAEVVRTLIRAGAPLEPRQQPRMDGAHRIDRARRWRPASHRY